jgi:hypothetical protein
MKDIALNVANIAYKTVVGIIILPFIALAFAITKLFGGEPFSMDDMGIGFMTMIAIAIGLAVATVAFTIGYLL